MSGEHDTPSGILTRVPTGLPGLDDILMGGLFKGAIYIVRGSPGAGKTIFANQLCFEAVRQGRRATYVTVLAETHARMLAQMRGLSFFDSAAVGDHIKYVNAYSTVESDGIPGLLKLLRNVVREQKAELLILDGMLTVAGLASSEIDYKKFLNELQTWIGMLGCTVVLLTSGEAAETRAEHTMVDGIIEFTSEFDAARMLRRIRVLKFRGSAFREGFHSYAITDAGVRLYPRLESRHPAIPAAYAGPEQLSFGVEGLDRMTRGGLRRKTTTLVLGPSGSGKTVLGLHFLSAGYSRGESTLLFGFFEGPQALADKGDRLGMNTSKALADGRLRVVRHTVGASSIDALGEDLLFHVDQTKATRVFVDGLSGLKDLPDRPRLAGFWAALSDELSLRGASTFFSEETRELFVQEIQIPTGGVSASFHNILFLRSVERRGELTRLVSVMKVRDGGHDRRLYEFDIGDKGMVVQGPFEHGGVMLGESE